MILYSKNTSQFFMEIYLMYPTIILNRKTESLMGGYNSTTKISVNLFNFVLTNNPLYLILEFGIIFGIGIKIIDKEIK